MSESIEVTSPHPSISGFYKNKAIFITGGTGFIGKVMLQKLLYSCRDVHTVYLLVRDKKGVAASTRIKELKKIPIFEKLNKEAPEQFDKIKLIVGDITKSNLGIKEEDLNELIKNVSVVFHIAAVLNFTDNLCKAYLHNVVPTKEVMKLSHRLTKLQVLVYVSTAYTNMNHSVIEEEVYLPPADLATIEYMANNNLDKEFKKEILGGHVNTYVYTKLLAENIVKASHSDIPVAIVRPSIVTSSLHGPKKGWMDNYNAASMIVAGIQTGVSRVILLSDDVVCDLVPVDLVANALLVCAARLTKPEVKVFNFTSGASNPITWGKFAREIVKSAYKHSTSFPWPYAVTVKSFSFYFPLAFVFQLVPSYLVHFILLMFRKKSRILDIQKKLMMFAIVTFPFTTQQWLWSDRNVRELIDTMTKEDQKTFDIDVKNINWINYFKDYTLGVKKYLLKLNDNK